MSRVQEAVELSDVRIPPELNARLDRFFSELKLRVLQGAARRASVRKNATGPCTLQADDLITTATGALAEARAELERAFSPRESQHVRRTS
jgi:hypothetical protein